MIKLRILRWGDYPGSSRCDLSSSYKRNTKEVRVRGEGDVTVEAAIKVIWPQDKECWQHLEVGRRKEQILAGASGGTSSADTLVLAQ